MDKYAILLGCRRSQSELGDGDFRHYRDLGGVAGHISMKDY